MERELMYAVTTMPYSLLQRNLFLVEKGEFIILLISDIKEKMQKRVLQKKKKKKSY